MLILKLTKTGPVGKESVARAARLPIESVDRSLTTLVRKNLIHQYQNIIEASAKQRIEMAAHALRLGADAQRVCALLSWAEFETIAAQAFEANGYRVIQNFRFKSAARRWEIDILGLKEPLILCVDCKRWKTGWRQAATMKTAMAQTERTEALTNDLTDDYPKMRLKNWDSAILVPLVLSLMPGPTKFCNDVPVVPILQLQQFINELPAHIEFLRHFHQKIIHSRAKLNDFCL